MFEEQVDTLAAPLHCALKSVGCSLHALDRLARHI
jgi:hypothetical protein